MTEDDTFRRLKRTRFEELFDGAEIHNGDYNLLEHIEKHGWTMTEYAGEYYDRNGLADRDAWDDRETYIHRAVRGNVRRST